MTATLPLLGTSLTVDVTLDASGNITGVALTPPGTLPTTKTSPTTVKFSNADGSTKVSVRARGSKLSISARSTNLADFVGSGTWAADVFGTGTKSTVAYTIADDGSGNPTLAIGAITTPAGVTSTVVPVASKTGKDGAFASGGVTFASNGFEKRLRISISVSKEKAGKASLTITLSGKDRQALTGTLADLAAVASRSWTGRLCDGTAVAVTYHVAADGTIVYDGATGATAMERSTGHGIVVRFKGNNAGVKISLKANADGTYTLGVKGQSGICSRTDHLDSGKGAHAGPTGSHAAGPGAGSAASMSGKAGASGK